MSSNHHEPAIGWRSDMSAFGHFRSQAPCLDSGLGRSTVTGESKAVKRVEPFNGFHGRQMSCLATHKALPFVLVPLIIDIELAGHFLQTDLFSV